MLQNTPLAFALALASIAAPSTSHAAEASDATVLSLTAEGRSTRAPDIASFSTGVASTGKTAGAAMAANAADMNRVIAALKQAGIADRDIQTSNLSLSPIYSERVQVTANGKTQDIAPRIIGYTANNSVAVRQRKLSEVGRVIDALVAAGANEISGPDFGVDQPEAALDEARTAAMKAARARAELYAAAAGMHVGKIVSISESGGYTPQPRMMMAKFAMADAAPTPVAAGEVSLSISVSVQFKLVP